MLLKEFAEKLRIFLSSDLFKDSCPNGIQVEGKSEIKKVGTAVSANLQTLEAAVERGVDALVVHHGLFWNGDSFPVVGSKFKKLKFLIENQLSLLAYHLPLDAHREVGNNWRAAHDLGWVDLQPFGKYNGIEIGVRGSFASRSIDSFVKQAEDYYEHTAMVALRGKKMVKSAALISGGAYKEVKGAAEAEVDCFITGNYDEPAWGMAYEEGIHFLALGHAATERIGPRALAAHIQQAWGLESQFIDVDNPF